MASKRILKKKVNAMIIDVVEESFDAQLFNPKKTEKSEAVINEAADFLDTTMSKVHAAKNKADYKAINEEIGKAKVDFVQKLNALK